MKNKNGLQYPKQFLQVHIQFAFQFKCFIYMYLYSMCCVFVFKCKRKVKPLNIMQKKVFLNKPMKKASGGILVCVAPFLVVVVGVAREYPRSLVDKIVVDVHTEGHSRF